LYKSEALPVQLSGEEFSPVLKNYVAVASSDGKDHVSSSGRSPCTAKINITSLKHATKLVHNINENLSYYPLHNSKSIAQPLQHFTDQCHQTHT